MLEAMPVEPLLSVVPEAVAGNLPESAAHQYVIQYGTTPTLVQAADLQQQLSIVPVLLYRGVEYDDAFYKV